MARLRGRRRADRGAASTALPAVVTDVDKGGRELAGHGRGLVPRPVAVGRPARRRRARRVAARHERRRSPRTGDVEPGRGLEHRAGHVDDLLRRERRRHAGAREDVVLPELGGRPAPTGRGASRRTSWSWCRRPSTSSCATGARRSTGSRGCSPSPASPWPSRCGGARPLLVPGAGRTRRWRLRLEQVDARHRGARDASTPEIAEPEPDRVTRRAPRAGGRRRRHRGRRRRSSWALARGARPARRGRRRRRGRWSPAACRGRCTARSPTAATSTSAGFDRPQAFAVAAAVAGARRRARHVGSASTAAAARRPRSSASLAAGVVRIVAYRGVLGTDIRRHIGQRRDRPPAPGDGPAHRRGPRQGRGRTHRRRRCDRLRHDLADLDARGARRRRRLDRRHRGDRGRRPARASCATTSTGARALRCAPACSRRAAAPSRSSTPTSPTRRSRRASLLDAIEDGWDVVVGNRFDPRLGGRRAARSSATCVGRLFNLLTAAVLLGQYRDTQCGCKAFRGRRRAVAVRRGRGSTGSPSTSRCCTSSSATGCRCTEVPVTLDAVQGSTVARGPSAVALLRDLLRVRRWARKGELRPCRRSSVGSSLRESWACPSTPSSRPTTSAGSCPTSSTPTWRGGSAPPSPASPARRRSSSPATCGRRAWRWPTRSPTGANSQGVDVVDLGLASTDLIYFAAGTLDAPGAMFTASHNPAGYNGIKLCLAGAKPVGEDTGLREIKAMAEAGLDRRRRTGAVTQRERARRLRRPRALVRRRRRRCGRSRSSPTRANGMGGYVAPAVFAGPAVRARDPVSASSTARSRTTPPTRSSPRTSRTSRRGCSRRGADIGLAFDGDADRVFLVDEQARAGVGLAHDRAASPRAMLAKYAGRDDPPQPASARRRCPRSSASAAARRCAPGSVTRFIKQVMAETGAVFGGEHSAHYYFRDNYRADSGLIAALIVLEQLSVAGRAAVRAARAARALRGVGRDQHEGRRPAGGDRAGGGRVRRRRPGPPRRAHRRPRRLVVQPAPVEHRAAAAPQPRGADTARSATLARAEVLALITRRAEPMALDPQAARDPRLPRGQGPAALLRGRGGALQPAPEAALRRSATTSRSCSSTRPRRSTTPSTTGSLAKAEAEGIKPDVRGVTP